MNIVNKFLTTSKLILTFKQSLFIIVRFCISGFYNLKNSLTSSGIGLLRKKLFNGISFIYRIKKTVKNKSENFRSHFFPNN